MKANGGNIKVVIVENHPVMRSGIRSLLEQNKIRVVAEADNGRDGVDAVIAHQPDVVVLDIALPLLNGVVLVQRLHHKSTARFVVYSSCSDEGVVGQLLDLQVSGMVAKSDGAEELI